uniref:A20-type domain-containing protein n=1 Tax=Sinocyclocheilus grahami TaxID=75366 RepID=A0A672Q9I2_SINGR
MNAQGVRRGFSVQQSDLMCKRGCGFYGNAVWQGLCSKCWRQENQCTRAKQIEDDRALAERRKLCTPAAVRRHVHDQNPPEHTLCP